MHKEDENMPTPTTAEKAEKKTPKKRAQISPAFLATAQRLPVVDGKIVLDRNNPQHVKWDTER